MSRRPTVLTVLAQVLPLALVGLCFAGVGVVHVTSRVMGVKVGYRLSTLEQEGRALTGENDRLRLELATLKSPARLERIARDQLGMVRPPAGTVVTIQGTHPPTGARARRITGTGVRVAERGAP